MYGQWLETAYTEGNENNNNHVLYYVNNNKLENILLLLLSLKVIYTNIFSNVLDIYIYEELPSFSAKLKR